MAVIDLRSDTLTKPSKGMLRAMLAALVGDDHFGEDGPTNELEERCADLLGMEAAVFMTSGTLSNQVALRLHTRPGDEVVTDECYHLNTYESAPSADLAGVSLNPVRTVDGVLTPEHVLDATDGKCRDERYSRPVLVVMENTINYRSGKVVPFEALRRIREHTATRGLAVHLDGARLYNASIASGTPMPDFGSTTDTVSLCFAKGLGAPFGSVLAGPDELMQRARYFRKSYGGALHQSGHLAAAALFALDHNVERLAHDHETAAILADALHGHPLLDFDRCEVQSNIVIVDVVRSGCPANQVVERLAAAGVLAVATSRRHVRFVTRMGIEPSDVQAAAKIFFGVLDAICYPGAPAPSRRSAGARRPAGHRPLDVERSSPTATEDHHD